MLRESGRFTKKFKLKRSKHWEGRQRMTTFQELREMCSAEGKSGIFSELQAIETDYSLGLMGSGKIEVKKETPRS